MGKNNKKAIQLGNYRYNPVIGVLYLNNEEVEPGLTPTEASVLEFLYSEPGKIFSRRAILKHIAGKRVVGPEVITQYIKAIRRALKDSASNPRYIKTYQKRGYCFIAPVAEAPSPRAKTWRTRIPRIALYLLLFLAAISTLLLIQKYYYPDAIKNIQPTPLTSLTGQEIDGDVSSDDKFLIFSYKPDESNKWKLMVKHRHQENYAALTSSKFSDHRPKFSPSGKKIIYHRDGLHTNQIHMADFDADQMLLKNDRVLMELPEGLQSVYLEWKNETQFYYSSSSSHDEVYGISRYDLTTSKSLPITHPKSFGHGDLGLSYSSKANKLAILRNIAWQKTQVVIYDSLTKEFRVLATIPYLIYSLAWNNSGTGVFIREGLTGLGFLPLTTGKFREIYQSRQPLYAPFQLSEGVGFMVGGLVVTDIMKTNLESSASISTYLSSSSYDYLPAYAPSSGAIVFVSARSGSVQVWIREKEGSLRKISNFDRYTGLVDLAVESHAKYLAYTVSAVLYLMDVKNGEVIFKVGGENDEHNNPAFSRDSKYLIYSVKKKGKWFLEKRAMDNLGVAIMLTEGFIAKPSDKDDSFYYLKLNNPQLYKFSDKKGGVETPFKLDGVRSIDQFYILNNKIYYTQSSDGENKLFELDMINNTTMYLFNTTSARFAFNPNDKLIYTSKSKQNDTHLESFLWDFQ